MDEQQILIDNYKRLPADLQQVVGSIVQRGRLSQVLAQYKIPKEQLEAITEETLLILLGIEHMSNYEFNLKSVPGLDSDLASTVAGHVHMEVFRSIDESLEEIGKIQKALAGETESNMAEKEGGVVDTLRKPVSQVKKSYALTWFVSRERQDIANQLREKLDKTERLIVLVRNFNGSANDQQPQTPNQ
ncbi:hypothetical protein IIB51_01035 [Patescibacteria group bacterium]|nr:hypothetical protein [Patescibacteria group bacterium]